MIYQKTHILGFVSRIIETNHARKTGASRVSLPGNLSALPAAQFGMFQRGTFVVPT